MDRRSLLLAGGACAALAACALLRRAERRAGRRRYCAGMIKVRPGLLLEQYRMLHDACWTEVLARMHKQHMRDFSVWLHEETHTMFHSFVYVGDDFEADMAAVDADPVVRFWWSHCEPCQEPLHWRGPPPSQGGLGDPAHPGEWWSPLQLVTHCGGWATAWSDSYPDPHFVATHPRGETSTKERPPAVHNRPAGWTSFAQPPLEAVPQSTSR